MYDPRIVALAEEAQRKHAALIDEANVRTSLEARFQIADALNGVRRDFRNQAIVLLGVALPMNLQAMANENHALVIAVNDDFEDTIALIKALGDQEILAKRIRSLNVDVLGGGAAGAKLPDLDVPWYVWAALIAVIALAFRPR